jgi:hypothetical protein
MAGLKSPPLMRAKHHAVTVSEKPKAKAMSATATSASAQRIDLVEPGDWTHRGLH